MIYIFVVPSSHVVPLVLRISLSQLPGKTCRYLRANTDILVVPGFTFTYSSIPCIDKTMKKYKKLRVPLSLSLEGGSF